MGCEFSILASIHFPGTYAGLGSRGLQSILGSTEQGTTLYIYPVYITGK